VISHGKEVVAKGTSATIIRGAMIWHTIKIQYHTVNYSRHFLILSITVFSA
jgi:hypothetical protein